jgi:hypothetical protein
LGLLKPAATSKVAVMPEADSPMILILLSTNVGLLLLLAVIGWRISRRLARIERRLAGEPARGDSESAGPSALETSAGGAFETFLSEDPSRRNLPKGEQFAAYRKWRQEKGLNWSNS